MFISYIHTHVHTHMHAHTHIHPHIYMHMYIIPENAHEKNIKNFLCSETIYQLSKIIDKKKYGKFSLKK